MPKVIVIRHGNTFTEGEKPRRIGTTDLPLTDYGIQQLHTLSEHLSAISYHPDLILSSPLQRAQQSATILRSSPNIPLLTIPELAEIYYGPDENVAEEDVKKRLGAAYQDWELYGIIPKDWPESIENIYARWHTILHDCLTTYAQASTIFIVTSNGLARFLPQIISSDTTSVASLKTAHYGVLDYHTATWHVVCWNTPAV